MAQKLVDDRFNQIERRLDEKCIKKKEKKARWTDVCVWKKKTRVVDYLKLEKSEFIQFR